MNEASHPKTKLSGLAAGHYWRPETYEAERQNIYKQAWQVVGPAQEVEEPGRYFSVDLAGWRIAVVRGRDGVLRAFHNVCRHRGAVVLPEAQGRCDLIVCPYHKWVYGLDGALRQAPYFGEDPGFDVKAHGLKQVHVEVWRGLVFVSLAQEPEPLKDGLSALVDEIAEVAIENYRAVKTLRFEIAANWKTYTDNFVEGYHILGIHPGFLKLIDFEGFETVALDRLVRMTAPQKEGAFYSGKWLWLWPNTTLSTFPGGMNTSRINPTGPESCELIYHFYFAEGDAARHHETISRNAQVVREDFSICETTQKNLRSGAFTTGPLSPRHEQGVAAYQQRWRQVMKESLREGP